jgi:hypothetical protein
MQRLESDALRLQDRFFRDPKTEKYGCTLLLSRLHNHGMFGGGKVPLGKFYDLHIRANPFEIHSNLLPL